MEAVPVLAIAVILYCICEILKGTILKNNEDAKAVLPYSCAILGAVFAVIIYCFNPELIGAENILNAIVMGAISGLIATGGHQIYKQFSNAMDLKSGKDKDDSDENNEQQDENAE